MTPDELDYRMAALRDSARGLAEARAALRRSGRELAWAVGWGLLSMLCSWAGYWLVCELPGSWGLLGLTLFVPAVGLIVVASRPPAANR